MELQTGQRTPHKEPNARLMSTLFCQRTELFEELGFGPDVKTLVSAVNNHFPTCFGDPQFCVIDDLNDDIRPDLGKVFHDFLISR